MSPSNLQAHVGSSEMPGLPPHPVGGIDQRQAHMLIQKSTETQYQDIADNLYHFTARIVVAVLISVRRSVGGAVVWVGLCLILTRGLTVAHQDVFGCSPPRCSVTRRVGLCIIMIIIIITIL